MARAVKVAVLAGGNSPEREVSLRSGAGVHAALIERGYVAELIDVTTFAGLPQLVSGYDAVFNVLHGGAGEDGTVQLLLDLLGKPYVGSGPLASAIAMDKLETHRRLEARGIPVPGWLAWEPGQGGLEAFVARVQAELGLPAVVKPRGAGSSVGLHLVRKPRELTRAVEEVGHGFGGVLVEEYVPGRELTCGLLEGEEGVEALPVLELRPLGKELFDWEAKYTPGRCEFICPADLEPELGARIQELSRRVFSAIGCRDLARVDFRLTPEGEPYVLEVNTLPGMTEMSTLPRMARAAGMSYGELVERLIRRAISRLPSREDAS